MMYLIAIGVAALPYLIDRLLKRLDRRQLRPAYRNLIKLGASALLILSSGFEDGRWAGLSLSSEGLFALLLAVLVLASLFLVPSQRYPIPDRQNGR